MPPRSDPADHDRSTLRVSVVMATYNGARHVREQLQSMIDQTFPPYEILVGDDGSVDETAEVVAGFSETSPVPVRLTVNQTRLGYTDNFLETAERAEGDLIAFSDQDDVWYPDKLAQAASAFRDPGLSAWMHGLLSVDEDLHPLPYRRFHTGLVERTQLKFPILVPHGARMVFRAEVLKRFPAAGRALSVYGDRPAHHDEWIMFGAHALGRIGLHRKPLMKYRRHGSAVSADCDPVKSIPDLLLDRPAVIADEAAAARDRARYLRDRAADPANSDIRTRLLSVARYYDELAPRIERRATVRCNGPKSARMASLLAHLVRSDYRPIALSGLGLWCLAQDLTSTFVAQRPPPTVRQPASI